MELANDWFDKFKSMVEAAEKRDETRHIEKVLLVNNVMHRKLKAMMEERSDSVDYDYRDQFGIVSSTIGLLSGALEVHTIGPLQYSLYKDMDPDNSALLIDRAMWDYMCGKMSGPQLCEHIRFTHDNT